MSYNSYNQQFNPLPPPDNNEGAKIGARATKTAALITAIGALIGVLITTGIIFPHPPPNPTPVPPTPTPTPTPTPQPPPLHNNYSGLVTESGPTINGTLTGILTMVNTQEDNNGNFTASGDFGGCTVMFQNGMVQPNGKISFSMNQIGEGQCGPGNASFTGIVGMDGSNPNGIWEGNGSYGGQWALN